MSNKNRKTPFNEWETIYQNGEEKRYMRMGNSQMTHPAFLDLSHPAVNVYIHMKIESGGKRVFEFPYSKYKVFISKQGFQTAKDELVKSGFIQIAEKNANLRKPNKYRFSTSWKSFEKP